MISVVVPFLNYAEFLEECLIQLGECNKEIELETILVNDHSAEDISNLVKKYKEEANIKYHELPNGRTGNGAAKNYGLSMAKGNYVYFTDADDYVLENPFRLLLEAIEKENADLAYGKMGRTYYKLESAKKVLDACTEADEKEEKLFAEQKKDMSESKINNYADGGEPVFENIMFELCLNKTSMKDFTSTGILFNRQFLIDNEIVFDENNRFYSEAVFLIKAIVRCKKYACNRAAIYLKREHNNKIDMPSLSQLTEDTRYEDWIGAYTKSLEIATDNEFVKLRLERMLCTYFINQYAPRFHWGKPGWDGERFDMICDAIKKIDRRTFKEFVLRNRILLKAAMNKNLKAVKRQIKINMFIRKMKRVKNNHFVFATLLNNRFFQKLSIKENWVVFESFVGRNYSGQPKYIYRYLAENYPDKYRFIWILNDTGTDIEGKCVKIKRRTIKYVYYMARAKYIVFNTRQPKFWKKREEQVFLETWHGTPLKKLFFDMDEVHSADKEYKASVYNQSREWDYLVSDNPFSTEKFASCFRFEPEKILEYGYPANDPLYAKNKEEHAGKIKKKFGIPEDKKVILYAPTWRDDSYYAAGEYKFELALDINRLREEFSQEYVLLLRMHYWIVDQLDLSLYDGFAFDGSSYDDITDLYLISDICITDYSSVFFDYANLKRPILFYTYDLEKYRDVLRGFYLDMEKDLPGPLLITNDEVVDALKNIDEISNRYEEKYAEFYDRFCCIDDGEAAKRIVNKVFKDL